MLYKLLLLAIVGCVAAAATTSDDEKSLGGRIPLPNPSTSVAPNTTIAPPTTTPAPKPTTTPAPKPTTTPAPKPTTPPSPKTSTTAPNSTTTSAPTTSTTTTSKPPPSPPTPPPNSTTTEKPTTTVAPAPTTTTAKPTPIPPQPKEPIPGTWAINITDTNRTCIVVTLAAQIEIPYKVGKTNYTGYINITPNATAIGSCGNLLQSITLQWPNNLNVTNNVTFTFQRKNVNATKFDLAQINVAVSADNSTLPGYNGTFTLLEKQALFNTSLEHSYKCFKRQTFNLTDNQNSNVTAGFVHLQHVQLQAFRNATGIVFAEAEDCAPRETPDVVPIAVGCALIALIIIVLAAYLIGRRRNQARGYLSMFSAEKKEADYIPMKNLNCFN